MGYKIPNHTLVLKFQDTSYEGAEVECTASIPIGKFIEWSDLIDKGKALHVFEPFGDAAIKRWNLEDDNGKPIPASGKSMIENLDPAFASLILNSWMEAIQNPPAPLYEKSSNGNRSVEPSMPMEVL